MSAQTLYGSDGGRGPAVLYGRLLHGSRLRFVIGKALRQSMGNIAKTSHAANARSSRPTDSAPIALNTLHRTHLPNVRASA